MCRGGVAAEIILSALLQQGFQFRASANVDLHYYFLLLF